MPPLSAALLCGLGRSFGRLWRLALEVGREVRRVEGNGGAAGGNLDLGRPKDAVDDQPAQSRERPGVVIVSAGQDERAASVGAIVGPADDRLAAVGVHLF